MTGLTRTAWDLPGTVLLLDDDETFVRSLAAALEPVPSVAFTAAGPALRHLHTVADGVGGPPVGISHADDGTITEAVTLRTEQLARFIRSPSRFAMVTVAIVDQVMPAMSGTVFCDQVRDFGVKSILLSGRMSDGEAVAAFNQGVIDRYLEKNDPAIMTKLPAMIRELHACHARDRSARYDTILGTATRGLFDRYDLWALLQQVSLIFPFCEHYFDASGPGFLLINEAGDHRFLLVDDAEEQRRSSHILADVGALEPERLGLAEGRMLMWNLAYAIQNMDRDEIDLTRFVFPANRHGSLVWALIAPNLIPSPGFVPEGSWDRYRSQA